MKKNMVQLFMLLLMLLLMSGCEKSKADFGQSENTNQSEIEQNNNMGPNEEINFYGIDMSLSKDEIYSEIGNNNIIKLGFDFVNYCNDENTSATLTYGYTKTATILLLMQQKAYKYQDFHPNTRRLSRISLFTYTF